MIAAPPLKDLPDIEHGFGARADGPWLEPASHAWLKQVHSARVLRCRAPGEQGEADALITTTPDLWISIRTADCLPILIADPSARIVAAVHAGWRGTAAGIVSHTVQQMVALGAEPSSLVAAIGPGIAYCCFEVGPEVSPHFGAEGRTCVDLAEANERQLLDAGLDLDRIWVSKLCTKCNPGQFHSFRRDGDAAGRMVSAIRII
jgi:YfiH family protein